MFVAPPYRCWGVQAIGNWPPVQLAYLAGEAEKVDCEARIFDAMNKDGADFETVREEIERYAPDAVLTLDYLPVSGAISTATVPAAVRTLAIAKAVDDGIVTLLAGPHPTFLWRETLSENPEIDFILRGEAEETLREWLLHYPAGDWRVLAGLAWRESEKLQCNALRPHIMDLDSLEPAWHLLDWSDYRYHVEPYGRMASMLTTRGCMMSCSFCSHRVFWRKDWRARDPHRVIEEMQLLVERFGVDFITLIDPYPTHDPVRWERQLDGLIEARLPVRLLMETRAEDIIRDRGILWKYREAGVMHMYVGAESSSDALLASLNKGMTVDQNKLAIDLLREHEIMSEASFMIGFPEETRESIDRTIAEAIRLDPDIAVFPIITPMPFTPLYHALKERIRVHDWAQYNLMTPIVEPYAMTLAEVKQELARCYMSFYLPKMSRVLTMPDGFKRRYMLSAFNAMMKEFRQHFSDVELPVGLTEGTVTGGCPFHAVREASRIVP